MQQLWAIVLLASVVIMGINHPIIVGIIAAIVLIYFRNPWNLKMKVSNAWKKMTTKKPQNPNRRPRVGEGGNNKSSRPRWE